MSRSSSGDTANSVSPAEIDAQLDRIFKSPGFRNSQRLRRFLEFTVRCVVSGTTDQLKESVLGRTVFDRGSRYDPRIDSIVRVESQRLRRKLEEYYAAEGRREAAFRDAEARERQAEAEARATTMVSEAISQGDLAAANPVLDQTGNHAPIDPFDLQTELRQLRNHIFAIDFS